MSHPGSTRDTQEPPRGAPRRHPGGIRRHQAPSGHFAGMSGHLAGMGEPKCLKSVILSSKTRWSTFPGRIHTHLECTPWNH